MEAHWAALAAHGAAMAAHLATMAACGCHGLMRQVKLTCYIRSAWLGCVSSRDSYGQDEPPDRRRSELTQ